MKNTYANMVCLYNKINTHLRTHNNKECVVDIMKCLRKTLCKGAESVSILVKITGKGEIATARECFEISTLGNEIVGDVDESIKDIYNDLCYIYEDIMPSLLNSFEEQSVMGDIKKELLFVKYRMSQIISYDNNENEDDEEDDD